MNWIAARPPGLRQRAIESKNSRFASLPEQASLVEAGYRLERVDIADFVCSLEVP